MGKSPGKWIKTVLFGKKTSRSNYVKGKEVRKSSSQKESVVRENAVIIPAVNPPSVSSNVPHTVDIGESNLEYVNKESPITQQEELGPETQNDSEPSAELNACTDAEKVMEEDAAIRVQAVFKGYLARRAFKALKGIIRLQALVRGHLVRRQAVSTLHCLMGIIKLQAIARGSKVRCSETGLEVQNVFAMPKPLQGKLTDSTTEDTASRIVISSENVFVRKLLASHISVMALRVQYDPADPSSAMSWVERWSSSNIWKPAPRPKKAVNTRSHKKQGHFQTAEAEAIRPKLSVRRIRGSFDNNASSHSGSEPEKTRRVQKKVSSHLPEPVPENPQIELEKVKRSLRKVHRPVVDSSAQSEAPEKPSDSQEKAVGSSGHDVSEPAEIIQTENVVKEETAVVVDEAVHETVVIFQPAESEEQMEASETIESSNGDHVVVKSPPVEMCEKDMNIPLPSAGDLKSKDDSQQSENQKSSRRSSFPAKQEREEVPQNTPKVPSYMQATQSAKAKLRAQNSPRLSQDGNDKNHVARRHSLPSPANGKLSSSSPRTQRPLNASGKSGGRSDKSLSSSKEGKAGQTEWRR